jgi:dihydroneopterin aldolase
MSRERTYRILVKDLVLLCSIGAYPEERLHRQRVRFNVDLHALWPSGAFDDDLSKVVNYKDITNGIRALVEEGHINLVETLAERIADMCLADRRVVDARVSVEKLDVEPAADGIGVEIERHRSIA